MIADSVDASGLHCPSGGAVDAGSRIEAPGRPVSGSIVRQSQSLPRARTVREQLMTIREETR